MEKWIILGLSLFALAHQTEAAGCPVDVVFIIDASKSISDPDFQLEKDLVKRAAGEMDIARDKSRAAIIMFRETALVTVTLGQYPTYEEFQRAVDSLNRPADQISSHIDDYEGIKEALNAAANDVFSAARTSVRRIAMVLGDGRQILQGSRVDRNIRTASENLRKLGVRVLAVAMGHVLLHNTTILRMVTEREEDMVKAGDFDDLMCRLPGVVSCAACVCTTGDSYITIDNYQTKKNRNVDDIRFEFKSDMTGPGMIMHAKGDHNDYVYVGYKRNALDYNFELGTGERLMTSRLSHIGTKWHKVHMTRVGRFGRIEVEDASHHSITEGKTPGCYNGLDIPSSKGYFLGSPTEGIHGGLVRLPPNFIGCIRYLSVDGYEPIVNAWGRSGRNSSVVKHKGSIIRSCTASDESY